MFYANNQQVNFTDQGVSPHYCVYIEYAKYYLQVGYCYLNLIEKWIWKKIANIGKLRNPKGRVRCAKWEICSGECWSLFHPDPPTFFSSSLYSFPPLPYFQRPTPEVYLQGLLSFLGQNDFSIYVFNWGERYVLEYTSPVPLPPVPPWDQTEATSMGFHMRRAPYLSPPPLSHIVSQDHFFSDSLRSPHPRVWFGGTQPKIGSKGLRTYGH